MASQQEKTSSSKILPLKSAADAFRNRDFRRSIQALEDAAIRYPHWSEMLNTIIRLQKSMYPTPPFEVSYDVEIKIVPNTPPEFPKDLVLPALVGVANDYTHIEEAVALYLSNNNFKYYLPVSVIIPVYNRSRELDFVLAGLVHQTYPSKLIEVIISDDGSQEDLSLIYNKYKQYFKIKYCKQEDKGYRLARARNLGVCNASHDSIIILDCDAIPNKCLVEEYMKRFHVNRNCAMFGLRKYVLLDKEKVEDFIKDSDTVYNTRFIKSENSIASRISADGCSVDWRKQHLIKTDFLKNEPLPYRFMVGVNCGFSRELFNKVNGYSEDFTAWGYEDSEYAYRLYREGAYFIPLMDAYVYHQEPLTGKNDTDRELGQMVTKKIFIQKCPFIYRNREGGNGPFEAPLVSIYVPLYNREKYIVECVESALCQTVEDLEVIVCDDGSKDRSVEIFNRHFLKHPRVRLIHQKHAGIGATSNTAVRAAKGFYIGQLDADDVLKIDAVEQCLNAMEKNHKLSLVYGTTEYIDEHSTVLQEGWNWPVFSRKYLLTRMICHHFRFFRKRDWARTNGFNEAIKNAVDYDMMLKLAECGEVLHLNKVLYQYRKHSATTTRQDRNIQTMNNFSVINDSLARLGIKNYYVTQNHQAPGERAVSFHPKEFKDELFCSR